MASNLYTPLTATSLTINTGANAWHTIDCTSFLASDATGVHLIWTSSNGAVVGFRKTGSSDNSQFSPNANTQIQIDIGTGSGANALKFDFWTGTGVTAVNTQLYLVGQWGPGAVFLDPYVALGATTAAYAAIDLSATAAAGAQAAFYAWGGNPGTVSGVRQTGSTDDFSGNVGSANQWGYSPVGINSANKFDVRSNNLAAIKLIGYISTAAPGAVTGITWHTNAINQTPSTFGSAVALNTSQTALGFLYGIKATASNAYVIGDSSSVSTLPNIVGAGSGMARAMGPAAPWANVAVNTTSVFELAVFAQDVTLGLTAQTLASSEGAMSSIAVSSPTSLPGGSGGGKFKPRHSRDVFADEMAKLTAKAQEATEHRTQAEGLLEAWPAQDPAQMRIYIADFERSLRRAQAREASLEAAQSTIPDVPVYFRLPVKSVGVRQIEAYQRLKMLAELARHREQVAQENLRKVRDRIDLEAATSFMQFLMGYD